MIHIVVALAAEARPLIRHYKLRNRNNSTAFPVYRNDAMAVIVSGPGKVNAAAATAVLASDQCTNEIAAWLNIGIAGHAIHPVGTGIIAHRITDSATGTHWYPPQIHDAPVPTDNLLTVDLPENDYPEDALYDMEAAGFYPVACRFSTSELVQCYKTVSDNRQQITAAVTAKLCEQLLTAQLETIDQLVNSLDSLAREVTAWHAPHPDLERLRERWHFTVSQQHQLAQLTRRWQALVPGQPVWLSELDGKMKATEVLRCLEQHLGSI